MREGAPGTFYLYETVDRYQRSRWIRLLVFWLLVILIPLLFLLLTGGR